MVWLRGRFGRGSMEGCLGYNGSRRYENRIVFCFVKFCLLPGLWPGGILFGRFCSFWIWSFLCLRWVIRRDLRFFVLVCICLEEGCDILIFICFEEEESNVLAEVEVSILGGFGIVFWRIWRFWYF